jgi:hypothetical protein
VNAVNAWHVSDPDLVAYLSGTAGTVLTASVESHLLGCAGCRGSLATVRGAEARADSERRWTALVEHIDRPQHSWTSRVRPVLLTRASVSSPPLLAAWLFAVVAVLVLPVLPVVLAGRDATTALLAVAPLAPLGAVALAYRRGSDPAGELALATPLAGFRLVAVRALLVALVAAPVGVLAAFALGLPSYVAFGWLLPGLALCSLVLLGGTVLRDPSVLAGALGAGWALAVSLPALRSRGTSDLVADLVASSGVQLLTLTIAVAALALACARRDHVTYRRTA